MCILHVWHIPDYCVLCNVVADVEMGTSSGCAFFYVDLPANGTAHLQKKRDFFKVLSGMTPFGISRYVYYAQNER